MDSIQELLNNSSVPAITAFLLGILTAISPCPLATNITAIGYISKDIEQQRRIFFSGLIYTLGRVLTYMVLAFILIPIIQKGASMFAIQKAISTYGEMILGPVLILVGVFMLVVKYLKLGKFGFSGQNNETFKKKGYWGALLLGILFALAFCPTSGVFYFGILIPLSAAETGGYLLPLIFAIATGLPVIIVSWILAFSVSGLGKFYNSMQTFQKWMNIIIALLFIGVGIYYLIIVYF